MTRKYQEFLAPDMTNRVFASYRPVPPADWRAKAALEDLL